MDNSTVEPKMEQFPSSVAKQQFGQVIKAAGNAPVAIEKHGKVVAYVISPERFHQAQSDDSQRSARQLARANQAMVEKDRLNRHHRIALDLVTMPLAKRDQLIQNARAVVDRWKNERLCSADYIQKWEQILNLDPVAMASTMVSDVDGWGPSLRQNSPWVGVRA
jgi:PHD/YefM family antitoxin component YafN of YafNO toxin-antitoxin module